MISSKKLTTIGIVLIILVIVLLAFVIVFKDTLFTAPKTGDITLDKEHVIHLSADDYYTEHSAKGVVNITLTGDNVSCNSNSVSFDGKHITIGQGGSYVISGELNDGSVIINSSDETPVILYLDGASISSSDYAPLVVLQSKKTILSLVPNTENSLVAGEIKANSDISREPPTAVIFSADDLVINGTGNLTVNGSASDGIKANDTLKIIESTLHIASFDEGINVNDSLYTSEAKINITSVSDAVKCEKTEFEQSFISINDSTFNIITDGDGIYSSGLISLKNATADIKTGEGAESITFGGGGFGGGRGGRGGRGGFGGNMTSENTPSTKGIKAGVKLEINGGTFNLNCADDAIHSDGEITVDGGVFGIATGNDAIHAENELTLSPTSFDVTKCLEGLEGAHISIKDGTFNIVSGDDAINAVGYNSYGGGMPPMMGAHSQPVNEEDIYLEICGGNITITSSGDGVDSNGAARITGGNLRVYGPENGGNGTLDFQNGILLCGGTLIAAGNSGMAESPHTDSEQISLTFYTPSYYERGSTIEITDDTGNILLSGMSSMRFNWVCVSCPEFMMSKNYTLKINGEAVSSITVSGSTNTNASYGRR